MKTHIINRFIAITAVAWLGQAGAEAETTQRLSDINRSTSSPATAPSNEHAIQQSASTPSSERQNRLFTLHTKSNHT